MSIINSSKSLLNSIHFIGLVVLGFLAIVFGAVVSRSGMRSISIEPTPHFINTAQADTPHSCSCASLCGVFSDNCGNGGSCGCYADADFDGLGDCVEGCNVGHNDGDSQGS